MDLSVIIVNWNSARYAIACIESIHSLTSGLDFEIIVVDNASTDDSCRTLRERFPDLRLIRSPENLGFARANNLGFESCSGRSVLFLNPDTELLGPAINLMFASLDSTPGIGVLGCKLLNTDLSIQSSCIQPYPTILNQILDVERLQQLSPKMRFWGMRPLFEDNNGRTVEVDMVSGACLMAKRQALEMVGLFDPEYFMYTEDLDLCYRARKAGWKVAYLGGATMVHHGGQSTKEKGGSSFSIPVMKETLLRFFQKTRGNTYAQLYRAAMLLMAVIRLSILGVLLVVAVGQLGRESLRLSFAKWYKILRWALGLEPWTQHVGKQPRPKAWHSPPDPCAPSGFHDT